MIIILRDSDRHDEPCAIITTQTSTEDDIQEAIDKVKEIDCYDSDDLEEGLPEDCEISWIDGDAEVYW